MQWFGVITLFPAMFDALISEGVVARALSKQLAQLDIINLRDFGQGNYKRVDERPFGGGPGMVMMAEPLEAAITHAKQLATKHGFSSVKTVLLSPQGLQWSHSAASAWQADGALEGLLLICGRYEGVDQRIINQYVDVEVSIGDFVLSGGELPAMVLMDSLVRLMDGALGDEQSAQMDSFSPLLHGLLDTSHYTKPVEFNGELVPKVLQSGNHARIAAWRFISSYNNTLHKRPDLLQGLVLNKQQIKWLQQVDEIQ